MTKKFLKNKVWVLLGASLLLSACMKNANVEPVDTRNKAQKHLDENGSFLGLNSIVSGKKEDTVEYNAINVFLWRGALDVLAVQPIDIVDVDKGFIQTEWVNITPTERVRISALIVSGEYHASGVQVNIYKQEKKDGEWVAVKVSRDVVDKAVSYTHLTLPTICSV